MRFDGGAYYILGTSLAEGKGYRLLNEPGEIKTTLHPPLLPLIVAAHQLILKSSDPVIVGQWLRLSFFFAFLVYILVVYLMFRLYLVAFYSFLATLICLLHWNTLFLSDLLFADLLFSMTTTLFFVCHKNRSRGKVFGLTATLLAIASYALRTVGVALLVAWIGESLIKKDFKKAALQGALLLISMGGWQAYIYSVEQEPQYKTPAYEYQRADYVYPNVSYVRNTALIDSFAPEKGYVTMPGRIKRFFRNVIRMPGHLGEAISTTRNFGEMHLGHISGKLRIHLPGQVIAWAMLGFLLLLSLLVTGGVLSQIAQRQWFIPLYVMSYLAILCLTPWPEQFNRYLMPLAPFLALSLFEVFRLIKLMFENFRVPQWKIVGNALSAMILLFILVLQSLTVYAIYRHYLLPVKYTDRSGHLIQYRQFFYNKTYQSLDTGLDWLLKKGGPGDVVAGSWPHLIYLRTGMKAVLPPFELDPDKAQHLLDTVPVKYLLYERDDFLGASRYVMPVLENGRWRIVFSTPDHDLEIYERVMISPS